MVRLALESLRSGTEFEKGAARALLLVLVPPHSSLWMQQGLDRRDMIASSCLQGRESFLEALFSQQVRDGGAEPGVGCWGCCVLMASSTRGIVIPGSVSVLGSMNYCTSCCVTQASEDGQQQQQSRIQIHLRRGQTMTIVENIGGGLQRSTRIQAPVLHHAPPAPEQAAPVAQGPAGEAAEGACRRKHPLQVPGGRGARRPLQSRPRASLRRRRSGRGRGKRRVCRRGAPWG